MTVFETITLWRYLGCSILKTQLEWLVSYFEGRNNERENLRKLVLGHYAVRELDERDVEFIDALTKAYYVASKTADGLKVDESILRGVS